MSQSPSNQSAAEALSKFLDVIAQLRSPSGGCPWDLKQTFESLRSCLIEESYEVSDAVGTGDVAVCESEKQVSELLKNKLFVEGFSAPIKATSCGIWKLQKEFLKLLLNLFGYSIGRFPVESDSSASYPDLMRFMECRHGPGKSIEKSLTFPGISSALLMLNRFPVFKDLFLAAYLYISEYMGMTTD